MLKIVYVISPPINFKLEKLITKNSIIIGVDGAIPELIKQNIKIDLAVGDFDSLLDNKLLEGLKVHRLNPEKDETDTYVAIKKAYELNPDYVYLIGGIDGPRNEHFLANLYLFKEYPNLEIKNQNIRVKMLKKGDHFLSFKGYISLFGYPEGSVSLEGFKYNLEDHQFKFADALGISNELTSVKGKITVHEGNLLMFMTKKA